MSANSRTDARTDRRPRAGPRTSVRPAHSPPRAEGAEPAHPRRHARAGAHGARRCHLPACLPVGALPGRSAGPTLADRAREQPVHLAPADRRLEVPDVADGRSTQHADHRRFGRHVQILAAMADSQSRWRPMPMGGSSGTRIGTTWVTSSCASHLLASTPSARRSSRPGFSTTTLTLVRPGTYLSRLSILRGDRWVFDPVGRRPVVVGGVRHRTSGGNRFGSARSRRARPPPRRPVGMAALE